MHLFSHSFGKHLSRVVFHATAREEDGHEAPKQGIPIFLLLFARDICPLCSSPLALGRGAAGPLVQLGEFG